VDARACNAVLSRRQDLSEGLTIVRIRPDAGPVPAFEPGQFIQVGLPRDADIGSTESTADARDDAAGTADASAPDPAPRAVVDAPAPPAAIEPAIDDVRLAHVGEPPVAASGPPARPVRLTRRPYSIASAATDRQEIELYLARIESGRLTPRIWRCRVGNRVWLDDRVSGHFTLADVSRDRDLLFIATGTGLAPFMSMLRTYRHRDRWRRLMIVHGVRRADDLGYRDELEAAAREDGSFAYVPIVSREPAGSTWDGLRGRVQAVLTGGVYEEHTGAGLSPERAHVFLCGNPAMIQDVEALLLPRGFRLHTRKTPGNLHYERYW
jgi:ferredoxin--NADP+ reductase